MRLLAALVCALALPAIGASTFTCTPSNNSILFGTYNSFSTTLLDSSANFVVTCVDTGGKPSQSTTLNWKATLSNQTLRQMAPSAGTDRLNYQIYTDANRSAPWGDGTGGTSTVTGVLNVPGSSSTTTLPITYYGRITPVGQDVSATASGSAPTNYSQVLTITVTCTDNRGRAVTC